MNNDNYKAGYEKAFGNPEVKKGRWLFDRDQGKFVTPEEFTRPENTSATILKAIDEFVSPIDGTVINDRAQLRRHNEAHGVSNLSDFGENNGKSYFDRKQATREAEMRGDTRAAKQERIETIKRALDSRGR
jgi:hypothetical protein